MLGGATGVRCFSVDYLKLEMPALSPTMAEGTVAKWLKKEGDKVDVGDVICEIQTDKATIGYESQEEGYIAKILSAEGTVSPIGGLIGVMVEEEEDIGKLDVSALQSAAASAPASQETPQEAAKAPVPEPPKAAKAPDTGAASAVGTEDFLHELEKMLHDGPYKVAPSAGFYMRTYRVLPSEVEASGPKGYIQKGDVLDFVEKNKLQKGQVRGAPAKSAPSSAASSPAAKKPKPAANLQSSAYDPSQPFKQSWEDKALAEGYS